MNKKIRYYSDGKKKKEVLDINKNGVPFKLITSYNPEGNIHNVMEKPDFKILNPCILVSGAHVFPNSEFNHIDFFQSGSLICKEYPEIRGSTNYGYNISGANLII